jgi:hypothetical protein
VIVEERIYTLQAGATGQYVQAYIEEGLAIQEPILGHLVGYYTTDIGPLNQVIHMWAYQDLEDRRVRRERLLADPRWVPYVAKVRPLIMHQENKILIPAPFSTVHRVEVQH